MKNQKGITLIAVVISIVFMMILVGVSMRASTGQNGVLNNTEKAVERTKESECKEFIIEGWAYALSKIDNNEVPYYNSGPSKTIQNKANILFQKYMVEYGSAAMVESNTGDFVFSITKGSQIYNAFKIKIILKGETEPRYFYIVNDKKVYAEREVSH